jgi:GH24 family phage-related lysozyme (muramidase)
MDLIGDIKTNEGLRLTAYNDQDGNPTIGYGHKILSNEDFSDGITEEQAVDILITDIDKAKAEIAKAFPWIIGVDDNRQAIITEMVFQLGIGGVQKFAKMLNALREKDYATAAKEMLNSEWHKQTPNRCEELAELMLNGG